MITIPASDFSEIDALQSSLNEALDAIRAEIHGQNLPELSIYARERHPLDEPGFLCSPRLYEARKLALASIGQLKILLQPPFEKAVEQSLAVYDTASLDIFIKTGAIDILALPENAARGLHIHELRDALSLDAPKLQTVLRYLAVQGWVYELHEGVFALTRPALELCKGRNGRAWAITPGKPKVAASLFDQLTHPQWRYSSSPLETAFQLSHQTTLSRFAYLQQNPAEMTQWSSAVKAQGDFSQHAVSHDYPWADLGAQTIVDCGGGRGSLTISLAQILPKCVFVITDLPEVVPLAQANIEQALPGAIADGRIVVKAHDLFEPQPKMDEGTVFVLRYILHDWTDSDCIKILKNIISLNNSSKVLILEYIAPPSTPAHLQSSANNTAALATLQDLAQPRSDVGHPYTPIAPPRGIPYSFGAASHMSIGLGVHLMGTFNARERSLTEWRTIMKTAGMEIVRVCALRADVSVIECTAAVEDGLLILPLTDMPFFAGASGTIANNSTFNDVAGNQHNTTTHNETKNINSGNSHTENTTNSKNALSVKQTATGDGAREQSALIGENPKEVSKADGDSLPVSGADGDDPSPRYSADPLAGSGPE